MAGISIAGLVKSYGRTTVLHGIDLEIKDGAFVVFVGPSGCGKSTLLRTIAGLEDPSGGSIRLDGRDVTEDAPVDRDVAMVFQSYALYPQMTVRQNIGFALEMAKVDRATRDAKVDAAAALLKLDGLLDRKPADLSGGQRQRVAIGRAILREPRVFLFDEPLSNLDAELRVDMRLQIASLRRELSATFVYVTHDQVEAMTLADTIVVLRDGRIEQTGAPLAVYHDPANRFVAGFLGSPKMNFLAATLDGDRARLGSMADGGGTSTAPDTGTLRLAGDFGARGVPVTLGLRPEHVLIDASGPLDARIVAIENLGPVSYAYCELADGDGQGSEGGDGQPLTVKLEPEHRCAMGDSLRLNAAPERVHVFDAEGMRLRAEAA